MQLWGEVRLASGRAAPPAAMEEPSSRCVDVAAFWQAEGLAGLHVTDLDGALERGRNWPSLEGAVRTGLPIRFGGGIRHMTDVQQLLELGVRQVVVGTQGLDNPRWLAELSIIFPGRILAGIDVQQGQLVVAGRRRMAETDVLEWARQAAEDGVAGFHYTELDDGAPGSPDPARIRHMADLAPVTVTAGAATPDTLQALREAGAEVAVVPAEAPPEAWRASTAM